MAITCLWNHKIGECFDTIEWSDGSADVRRFSIYGGGNCLAVVCQDSEDSSGEVHHSLAFFFSDKEHMKRCLGLDKKYNKQCGEDGNAFKGVERWRLNTAYKESKIMAELLVKADWENLSIEYYKEETK